MNNFLSAAALLIAVGIAAQITPYTNPEKTTQQNSESLDKYIGVYVFMKFKFVFNKFPKTSVVKYDNSSKYAPLDKKFIGKYFLYDGWGYSDTSKVESYAGGYIAPPTGNIVTEVDADGTIHIQNYNNYGRHGETMDFGLGGEGTYGKFVKRADGKYDLVVKGATYVWTQQ